jgi:WD40 repeat protein
VRTLPEPGGQLAFSPDGMSLVAVGGAMGGSDGRGVVVRLWDVQSGRLKQKLTLATESFVDAVSPDATIVATAGKGTVTLWRIR